ncbi:transposable element Tcb2 transposase [Trichonephila clavipes]|nr:transposable element Tcb2 transposase [Trichonephila clavipes]
MIWGVSSEHCFVSLVRVPSSFNAMRYVKLLVDPLHRFMLFCYPHDVLEQGVKGHHTSPTNLSELWTVLANIWQVIPMERFNKLVETMPHRVAAVIKARGGPSRY